jgi:uncharacterized protein
VPAYLWLYAAVDLLVSDKANTLFAVLFGIGFWVQLERFRAPGAAFERIYVRRLAVLLAIGLVNVTLIWPWDILNIYAVAGFALLALRNLSTRSMLAAGLVISLTARPIHQFLSEPLGLDWGSRIVFSDEAITRRQAVFAHGTYPEWLAEVARLNWYDYVTSGLVLAWVLYALGRFLVGAYIARCGWLTRTGELLPHVRRLWLATLPAGLALEGSRVAGEYGALPLPDELAVVLHAIGVPVLGLGYATGLILLFHSPRWRVIALAFAPVGRMALTNYLLQGVFIGLVLYGFHGGLGLAGTIQPGTVLLACMAFFAAQMAFSRWWLAHHAFGPMEWLWRALTYGERPPMRLAPRRRLPG